jgi:hypothetical protein
LSQSGLLNFLISVGVLLADAGAALWVRQKSSLSTQLALAQTVKIGIYLGIISLVSLILEHFAAANSSFNAVRGVSMWGLMFFSFGAAGSVAYQKVGSLGLAVVSSIWSSLVSLIFMLAGGFLLALLLMPRMVQILNPLYAQSGMTNPQAFVIANTLGASTMHLLLVPVVAAIFGLIGGCASLILSRIRQRVAILLGIFEFVFFIGGLASIRLASSLERAARPPYIMLGLLALGLTLACAYPILTVIRRPAVAA